jgi:hypothetical protein
MWSTPRRSSAADAEELPVLVAHVAELRRQLNAVAAVRDRTADQPLVLERPVHIRGVEEGHAQLERALDRGDRLALVRRAVELGHAHAAEPLCGYLEPLRAESSPLHTCLQPDR